MQVVQHSKPDEEELLVFELGEKEKPASEAQHQQSKDKKPSAGEKSLNAQVPKTTDTKQNGIEDPTSLNSSEGEQLPRADSPENKRERQDEDRMKEDTASERREKKILGKDAAGEEVKSEMEDEAAELQQRLACKEEEAEELRQSVEKMLEEKSKQMAALIMSIEEIEDSQIQKQKEISKLEGEVEMLNMKKTDIEQECEASDKDMKKLEKKRKKLEDFQQSYRTETGAKLKKLYDEIDSLQGLLSKPEGTSTEPALPDVVTEANPELLKFMESQIQDLEKDLECPVCFEIACQAPIFKCDQDHLICSKCREKVVSCPMCREEYPREARKRFRGAETQAERLTSMYKQRESLLQS